jgi:hypothetical protein
LIIPTTKPTNVALLLSHLSHLAYTNSGLSANQLFVTPQQVMCSAPFPQQVPAQDDNKGYTVHQQPQPMQMGQMQPQPMQMGQMGDGMGLPPPPFDAPPPAYEGGKVDTIDTVAKPAY